MTRPILYEKILCCLTIPGKSGRSTKAVKLLHIVMVDLFPKVHQRHIWDFTGLKCGSSPCRILRV